MEKRDTPVYGLSGCNLTWRGFQGLETSTRGAFAFRFEEISEILRIPNETVHSGCTDPNQATTLLVIVLVSRIPKQRYWGQQF